MLSGVIKAVKGIGIFQIQRCNKFPPDRAEVLGPVECTLEGVRKAYFPALQERELTHQIGVDAVRFVTALTGFENPVRRFSRQILLAAPRYVHRWCDC